MHTFLRSRCAPAWIVLSLLPIFIAGCGRAPVREDRSINFSNDGSGVGFQHGDEGLFLADNETGKLRKIFQPDSGVIATSSPLWSPAGTHVLFTTARATGSAQPQPFPLPGTPPDPAGKVFFTQPVEYTCYLYEKQPDEKEPRPVKLFEASCDHVGYVAANLAVRWHPKGDRVLYVKQVSESRHEIHEYDLAAKTSRQVFPHAATSLIFDFSPDGAHLACVLADPSNPQNDGIWIGNAEGADWWHVPESAALAQGEPGSPIENLRATRPAWTADGGRFAFPASVPGKSANEPARHFLRLGTLAGRTVETLADAAEPFRDLHWTSDGDRLGGIRGEALQVTGKNGTLSDPLNRRPVRQFAGWNATDKRLCYVAPERKSADKQHWALLFTPDAHGRDVVYVADGGGTEPGREVFSGMQITFPQWSPKEDKLSLWFTFTPTYHSAVATLLGGGLRRGDPAAVFDPATGKINWMAINPHEKAQVGHYYLLHRENATAWRWYEDAAKDWPAPQAVDLDPSVLLAPDGLQKLLEPQDIRFFQYCCLTRLGHHDEAAAKLAEFRKAFPPQLQPARKGDTGNQQANLNFLRDALAPDTLLASLVRDMYCTEVFLSLDATADAEEFFRKQLKDGVKDSTKLSSAIVLGQVLLLENKHEEYAVLTTDTVAPLLFKVLKDRPDAGSTAESDSMQQTVIALFADAVLQPLTSPEFVAGLPENDVRKLLPRWEALGSKAKTAQSQRLVDALLQAGRKRLGPG